MNISILLPLVLFLQISYASYLNICRAGTSEEVITMLNGLSKEHALACFKEALEGRNLEVVDQLPYAFHLNLDHCLKAYFRKGDFDLACFLLKTRWFSVSRDILNATAKSGNVELLRLLLRYGQIDPTFLRFEPLVKAAKCGHVEIAKVLVEEAHVTPFACGWLALTVAISKGHLDVAKYLMSQRVPTPFTLNIVFLASIGLNDVDFSEYLCNQFGVDPSLESEKVLQAAGAMGNVKMIQFLISKGVDLSKHGINALVDATGNGMTEAVKFFLSCPQIDLSGHEELLLDTAVQFGSINVLDALLEDARIMAALNSQVVNNILRGHSHGATKLVLLNWMVNNMTEVNMRWVPVYQNFMLKHPQFAANFQAVKDSSVSALHDEMLPFIAYFIEAWARALQQHAIVLSSMPAIRDNIDQFLCVALPQSFSTELFSRDS